MQSRATTLLRLLLLGSGFILSACSTAVVKPDSWDQTVASRIAEPESEGERLVRFEPALMGVSNEQLERGVYVGVEVHGRQRFGRLTSCNSTADRLEVALLPEGASPLDERPGRTLSSESGERMEVSISAALAGALSLPLPAPGRVFAVAANFPSHLEHDLAIDDVRDHRARLSAARPRVFQKFPSQPPPDARSDQASAFAGVTGPFDPLSVPESVALPAERGAEGPAPTTQNRLDYEVEIGVVFGRRLTTADLPALDDAAIRNAVAGYVLMSDAKARNPQVVRKVAGHGQSAPDTSQPHATGEPALDAALGAWDPVTCAWWSYAAGLGTTTAIGPYFVLAEPGAPLETRALAAARSYAASGERGVDPPVDSGPDRLLLRQASVCTADSAHPEALIWDVPAIVRSILAADSVLNSPSQPAVIDRGDILCLGTPGGTVITAKSQGLFEILSFFLSTWTPFDWHDAFFGDDAGLYLRTGDRLLLWADGLGAQLHTIELVPTRDRVADVPSRSVVPDP